MPDCLCEGFVSRFGPGIFSLVFAVVIFEMPKAGEVILIELLGAMGILPGLVLIANAMHLRRWIMVPPGALFLVPCAGRLG